MTPEQKDIGQYWWNINIPESQWTPECPEFLVGQTAKNIGILSRNPDEDRRRFNWEEVQEFAKTNRIHHFERSASALRAYLEYMHHLKKTYGSVLAFIQHQRLHWDEIVPSSDKHFSNPADFKVLYNDWPYHIDEDITHLIVWTKWQMDDEPATEEPTAETRREIEEFIVKTFCEPNAGVTRRIERDRIVWFKNWKSLKSVHALGG
ncbi:hypothetical protein LTR84_006450 [Exophiala bonariae]|uniref:Uncharacterized protein n=1 Tax=Exophiala bonariae TaxID=1690606 RepID=A0AAV9N4F3_9EURO|nr:hypothetical protein LTR84_006450 [Exophiala bonariae]